MQPRYLSYNMCTLDNWSEAIGDFDFYVLSSIQGSGPGFVDTDEDFYKSFGIKYKGLKLSDTVQTNISMYFTKVADYIDQALEQEGGTQG